jgi:hypothetical protein
MGGEIGEFKALFYVLCYSSSLSDPPILPADKNVARDSTGFSSGTSLFGEA